MHTWEQLRELRQSGHQPGLTLIVASRSQYRLRQEFVDIGAMVIEHEPADPIPAELLADLDMLLFFDSCKQAAAFASAIAAAAAKPSRCRAWCQCASGLTVIPDQGCKL